MHILLIMIILMLVLPIFARFVGSILSIAFWLIVVISVAAMVDSFSHRPRLRYRPAPSPSFITAAIMALTAFQRLRRLLPTESRQKP
jgi:hypothetical protein